MMTLDYPPMDRDAVERIILDEGCSCISCPWSCQVRAESWWAFREPLSFGWTREGRECPECKRRFTVYTHQSAHERFPRVIAVEVQAGWPPDALPRRPPYHL